MDFTTLIQDIGFPISCVLALGWYITKKDAAEKEEREKEREREREERAKEREEDKQDKERLLNEIAYNREVNGQLLKTNQEVSETNKLLAKDFTEKFDSMDKKMDKMIELQKTLKC